VLNCHIIDLDELTPLDVVNLRRFLSDDAEILGRNHTGLCAKCQRKVSKTIKTSRQLGMLPHIGQFMVEDSRPSHVDAEFHDVVEGAERITSKTIF
jgi:ribosomal protein S18